MGFMDLHRVAKEEIEAGVGILAVVVAIVAVVVAVVVAIAVVGTPFNRVLASVMTPKSLFQSLVVKLASLHMMFWITL